MCFLLHQPWRTRSDDSGDPWVKANHVMVLNYKDPQDSSKQVRSTFLCEWPDTTTQNYEDGLKVIYHDLQTVIAGGCINEIMAKTVEIAHKYARDSIFERVKVPQHVLAQMKTTNASMVKPDAKKWRLGHLNQDHEGHPCVDHAKYEYSDGTVIMSQSDMMLFIGYTSFLGHHNDAVKVVSRL